MDGKLDLNQKCTERRDRSADRARRSETRCTGSAQDATCDESGAVHSDFVVESHWSIPRVALRCNAVLDASSVVLAEGRHCFAKSCFIARDVFVLGISGMGEESSVSNNCLPGGSTAGIRIGTKAMIAPNCVLVAFDHEYCGLSVPMIDQPFVDTPIAIEDDVWIGANSTITAGMRLGKGCIVGANSCVTKDVEPYTIVGGVPARVIGSRRANGEAK